VNGAGTRRNGAGTSLLGGIGETLFEELQDATARVEKFLLVGIALVKPRWTPLPLVDSSLLMLDRARQVP